ncbi:acyltransferase ChoActase/COT/CPT [Cyathus striatus]|nr:acyltransferase ChoActase/COT/CPT [Cyathus striatus]
MRGHRVPAWPTHTLLPSPRHHYRAMLARGSHRISSLPFSPSIFFSRAMTTTSFNLSPRPSNWKAAAPVPLPGSLTLGAQHNLPKLPVPSLSNTASRLKDSLKPIAWSEEEYNAVVNKIDAFVAGKGPELQTRLVKRAEETPHWLEQWWDDGGYLGYRDSVVINVSYYYGFDQQPSHLPQSPAGRAAGIARAAMIFRQNLKRGLIRPEGTREGPICMDTYRWMFDCCRIPGDGLDWSISYAKEGDQGDSGHIVVIRNNRIWKIDATQNGRILSTEEFEKQIQHIYDNTKIEYPGVGVLTASNRDVWAKDYAELASSYKNASILETIESAAFVISLEASKPADPVHHSRALWHGDIRNGVPVGLRNRWVDKPLQFIIFDNSVAGFMGEHSVMDGTPTARMCDDVLNMLYDPAFDHGAPVSAFSPVPVALDWEVFPAIEKAIAEADVAARELIESQELGYFLTSYGKAAIKSFGVSPDSWAQMVVQLAYKRFLGPEKRTGGTYEAASTRKFYKGRTEAIRVVTSEADAWVQSMDDEGVSAEQRKKLFDEATKKHVSLAKNAGQGQGVDRHLYGLKKLLKEGEDIPELFSDPVLTRSSYWVLSTSAIFSKHFPVYGWGEVVPDGFGVAYMTGYDDRLQYTITSRKEMPNTRFVQEIAKAADDLYALHSEIVLRAKI